ncbi:MAG: hypothetical protein LBQ76_05500 [Candidatus Fibromonas sp.]|nr:hypothetical protein [Candidatus Fibromonas sp.]
MKINPITLSHLTSWHQLHTIFAGILLLESAIENSHQKQDLALEKTKDSFKAADFWGKWEREINEWRPKCE